MADEGNKRLLENFTSEELYAELLNRIHNELGIDAREGAKHFDGGTFYEFEGSVVGGIIYAQFDHLGVFTEMSAYRKDG